MIPETIAADPVLRDDWHVVARSAEICNRPVGAVLLGERIVLWRSEGRVSAGRDLCVHRGTRLSIGRIEGDRLVCAYHGWQYNGEGRCVLIPAHPDRKPPEKARIEMYHAEERDGLVWVCLGQPRQPLPSVPELTDSRFRRVLCGPFEVPAEGPRVIENFLDVTHFPYVHEGYLGDPQHAEINDYTATMTPDGIETSEIEVWQPDPDGTGIGRSVSYIYKVFRPLTAYFTKTTGGAFSILLSVTPVARRKSLVWMYVFMDYGDMSDAEVEGFQSTIFAQDMDVLTNQHPEELPLNLADELSLRSDRTSIAYRQWLKELGMTFGTC